MANTCMRVMANEEVIKQADWSTLPHDLLVEIVQKFTYIDEFVRLRLVCTAWKAAAADKNFNRTSPVAMMPWLMLPVTEKRSEHHEFHCFSKGITHRIRLPQPKRKIYFSSQGWLIIVNMDWSIDLVNPISGFTAVLPALGHPTGPFDPVSYAYFVQKVVISSNSARKSEFYVMIIHAYGCRLSFCRQMDQVWTAVDIDQPCYLYDVIYYNSKFYVTDTKRLLVCDVEGSNPTHAVQVARLPVELRHRHLNKFFLVEVGGNLLLVALSGERREASSNAGPSNDILRFQTSGLGYNAGPWDDILGSISNLNAGPRRSGSSSNAGPSYDPFTLQMRGSGPNAGPSYDPFSFSPPASSYKAGPHDDTFRFQVFQLDLNSDISPWVEVHDLGQRAIFLGRNSSFSLEVLPDSGFKANCIYFTFGVLDYDPYTYRLINSSMMVCDMLDQTTKPLLKEKPYRTYSPPIWIQLDFLH